MTLDFSRYRKVYRRGDALPFGIAEMRKDIWHTVCTAVKMHRRLEIAFVDEHGNRTRRVIRAEALARSGEDWYCLGFCETRQAARRFDLRRMVYARLLKAGEMLDAPFAVRNFYFGVHIPPALYGPLLLEFSRLAVEERDRRFAAFLQLQHGSQKYFSEEFADFSTDFPGSYIQQRDAELLTIPAFWPPERRCKLLKLLIEENEEYLGGPLEIKQRTISGPMAAGEQLILQYETEVRQAAERYIKDFDYDAKYDLSQLNWTTAPELVTFRKQLEAEAVRPVEESLSHLTADLAEFAGQWQPPGAGAREYRYEFHLPDTVFTLLIYDPKRRAEYSRQLRQRHWREIAPRIYAFLVLWLLLAGLFIWLFSRRH